MDQMDINQGINGPGLFLQIRRIANDTGIVSPYPKLL